MEPFWDKKSINASKNIIFTDQWHLLAKCSYRHVLFLNRMEIWAESTRGSHTDIQTTTQISSPATLEPRFTTKKRALFLWEPQVQLVNSLEERDAAMHLVSSLKVP